MAAGWYERQRAELAQRVLEHERARQAEIEQVHREWDAAWQQSGGNPKSRHYRPMEAYSVWLAEEAEAARAARDVQAQAQAAQEAAQAQAATARATRAATLARWQRWLAHHPHSLDQYGRPRDFDPDDPPEWAHFLTDADV